MIDLGMILTLDLRLQLLDVLRGHLDDLSLLDAALALLEVCDRDELPQVGQAVVHAVPPPLLNDPVRHLILEQKDIVSYSFFICSSWGKALTWPVPDLHWAQRCTSRGSKIKH